MNVAYVGSPSILLESCPSHRHNLWEIILNLEGSGTAFMGDEEYDFYPGTIFCLSPYIPHCKTSSGKFKDIYIMLEELPFNDDVLVFSDDDDKSFETLMVLAYKYFHKKDNNYDSIVDSLANSMHQILLSKMDQLTKLYSLLQKNMQKQNIIIKVVLIIII